MDEEKLCERCGRKPAVPGGRFCQGHSYVGQNWLAPDDRPEKRREEDEEPEDVSAPEKRSSLLDRILRRDRR